MYIVCCINIKFCILGISIVLLYIIHFKILCNSTKDNILSFLSVTVPPRIDVQTSNLRNTTAVLGQRLSFVCSARGYPLPLISWYLNDMKLQQGDPNVQITPSTSQDGYYNVTTSQLEIVAVRNEMSGKLKCVAIARTQVSEIPLDSLPDDEEEIQLSVLGKTL